MPPGNKKPAHRKTSAAGKYLTQMDLPLAAGEPSPPDRSRGGLRLARHALETQPLDHFLAALPTGPTRARFEFAARTHRGKFTPFCDEIAVTVALISRVLRIVKKRMAFESTFLFERP
jgi:hypothetical protein